MIKRYKNATPEQIANLLRYCGENWTCTKCKDCKARIDGDPTANCQEQLMRAAADKLDYLSNCLQQVVIF